MSKRNATLILVAGMLVSGVANTILNKLQDMQCVENCSDPDPEKRLYFEQPVWQTLNMFIGETGVWIVYLFQLWQKKHLRLEDDDEEVVPSAVNQLDAGVVVDDADRILKEAHPTEELAGWKNFLFWIPTICDLTATTLMNVGLIYTAASVYQMLRGAVVIFTGVFSYFFLKRRMTRWQWISLFLVVSGVSIVGLSSVLYPQERPSVFGDDETEVPFDWQSFLGVAFVLGAQILTATQFVVEEKIMSRYHVKPLRAVGLEGSFGLVSVLAGMPILYAIYGNSRPFFDMPRGWHQITANPAVWGTGIAIAFSIAFFNFFGLSITTTVSATARSTIDTCRTLFIWMVSLYLGWERFSWVQVIGFVILVLGTFIFNDVIKPPFFNGEEGPETSPLLREDENEQ
ncbi:hypothetical protein K450DRAFT_217090 [Umbelopsis ramanniana AG]|uniref:Integral membrane protein n=1 Tax=Umbelopsis ramanniana AG TaxID=1314678 RepID=A0AAD5EJA5_UMBRA|nr:uncharacterized protein K450DRAFT_217090 [Umbelopsis ramanniana AG]KAI8584604.1 hypothetical protein K450DRAFT_217090 [Umbelopsis ramanniana AG]